jgi:hypothetical protein
MKFIGLALLLGSSFAIADSGGPVGHALTFGGGALHAHCTWQKGPALSPAESILRVEWTDATDHVLIAPPGSFAVKLFMPDMGHGSSPAATPVPVLDSEKRPIVGSYEIGLLYFIPMTMEAVSDWEVQIKLKYVNGTSEIKAFHEHIHNHGP